MRIDCHVHTARHSSCSAIEPDALCRKALEAGLNALVLTDHHYRWTSNELAVLQSRHPSLKLYTGQELTLAEGYDVVCISSPLDKELRYGVSLHELSKALVGRREMAFLFVAHLFRYGTKLPDGFGRILRVMDGIELNSCNLLKTGFTSMQGFRIPLYASHTAAVRKRYGLVGLYNSDAHDLRAVGTIATEFDFTSLPTSVPPHDEAALARALRIATGRQYQNSERLSAFFYR